MEVYRVTTFLGFFLGLLFLIFEIKIGGNFKSLLLGSIVSGSFIALIVKITNGMGEGDIEIAFFIGIFLGLEKSILSLFLAIVIAGTFGSFLLISKKETRKSEIPFGPFLAIGAALSLFFGEKITFFYLNLF